MSKHSKYIELVLKEEGMPSHFLAGYEIVSDYRSEGKRKLFLKRPESTIAEVKPNTRRRKAKSNAHSEPATAFPGQVGANG